MDGELELFTKALGLYEPWKVTKVSFQNNELQIDIKFEKGYKFENLDKEKIRAYDTKRKTWRHLNFFQYKTFIHCDVPRIKSSGNRINMVDVPWSREECGFTMLFESFILALSKNMSISAVANIVGENDTRIYRIIQHYVNVARAKQDLSNVENIGVDETSVSGHNYITVAVNHSNSSVFFVTDGKDNTTIDRIAEELVVKGNNCENIKTVTADMSTAFKNGVERNFKNATLVFDKFHVTKLINEALDLVRKSEVKTNELLKKSKYLFLKRKDKLNQKNTETLDNLLSDEFLKTGIAYKLKLQFQDIYDSKISRYEAELRIRAWFKEVLASGIKQMKNVAKKIAMKLHHILNYFDNYNTNARLEGINSKIQLLKSRARGYKNIENFKTMIYFTCGKLDIDTSFQF